MSEGMKNDTGKLRYDLIPAYPLERLAEVYTIGAKKYADRNWEKGIVWGRLFAAMMRHAWKWWAGETFDPVDGQRHLASVAWCALSLIEFERTHPELDDRPIKKAPEVGAEDLNVRDPLQVGIQLPDAKFFNARREYVWELSPGFSIPARRADSLPDATGDSSSHS